MSYPIIPAAPSVKPDLIGASAVETGRTYKMQTLPETFTVLAIDDKFYARTSISSYRLAFVTMDGFYWMQRIHSNLRYVEVKGE
jgi:hypothetical protein